MKKFSAVILSLLMLLCLFPAGAFAENPAPAAKKIEAVEIVLVTPVYGEAAFDDSIVKSEGVSVESVKWYDVTNAAYLEEGDIYGEGLVRAEVVISADDGYEFSDVLTAVVNGEKADSVVVNQDGTVTVAYAFSVSAVNEAPGFFANLFRTVKAALTAFIRLIGTFIFGLK